MTSNAHFGGFGYFPVNRLIGSLSYKKYWENVQSLQSFLWSDETHG